MVLSKILIFVVVVFFQLALYNQSFSQGKTTNTKNEFVNLGKNINTSSDEFMPVVNNDTLYFRRSAYDNILGANKGNFYSVKYEGLDFQNKVTEFSLENKKNKGISSDISSEIVQITSENILFSSSLSLFNYDKNWKNWQSHMKKVNDLNSDSADFHPAISQDGKFIVFASTRKNANSGGGSDLYIVRRLDVGRQNWKELWTEPQNLNISSAAGIKINTEHNELAPFIDDNDTLWYASNGFRSDAGQIYLTSNDPANNDPADIYVLETELNYDIIKALPEYDNDGNVIGYLMPEKLPTPYNTQFDEAGIARSKDNIIISSNRPGGFGGYDLYAYGSAGNCRPVILNIKHESLSDCTGFSTILVLDAEKRILYEAIMEGKSAKIEVPYSEEFTIILKNACYPDGQETIVTAECSQVNSNSYNVSFKSSCNCPKDFMPFVVRGFLTCCGDTPFRSGIEIYNKQNILLYKIQSNERGYFIVKMDQTDNFYIRVKSDCLKNGFMDFEKWHTGSRVLIDTVDLSLTVPGRCCPSSNIHAIDSRNMFLNGYYIPNTYANIHNYIRMEKDLKARLKQYNSPDYIAFPSSLFKIENQNEFKKRTLEVEKKIAAATIFILDKINLIDEGCCRKLKIFINGYSDNKSLPANAAFIGDQVTLNNTYLKPGDLIDDYSLALLRAHFTAQMLKDNLSYDPVYAASADQVEWIIRGMDNVEKGKNKSNKVIDIIISCDTNE